MVRYFIELRYVNARDPACLFQKIQTGSAVLFIFQIRVEKLVVHNLTLSDVKQVEKWGDWLRIVRTRAAADDDRVLAGTLHRMQRDSGKVERLQNVRITHLILQGDKQEILVFHRLLGFQAEQRNVLFPHHAVQIRPWGINSLAPHVLTFVEHIVQDLDAKVGHTDLIHIREQECAAQGYFLFVFYDTVEFISNVSRRLLNLEQHFFWQC